VLEKTRLPSRRSGLHSSSAAAEHAPGIFYDDIIVISSSQNPFLHPAGTHLEKYAVKDFSALLDNFLLT